MTTDTLELPELPRPDTTDMAYSGRSVEYMDGYERGFEAAIEEMRAYATAAVLAERERCARIAEDMDYSPHGAIASAIRNKE